MKQIHAEGDTTQKYKIMRDDPFKDQMITHRRRELQRKQKTIRSQNTISEKDCRDLTKINHQRIHEGFDRSLPKVKLCRNRLRVEFFIEN